MSKPSSLFAGAGAQITAAKNANSHFPRKIARQKSSRAFFKKSYVRQYTCQSSIQRMRFRQKRRFLWTKRYPSCVLFQFFSLFLSEFISFSGFIFAPYRFLAEHPARPPPAQAQAQAQELAHAHELTHAHEPPRGPWPPFVPPPKPPW